MRQVSYNSIKIYEGGREMLIFRLLGAIFGIIWSIIKLLFWIAVVIVCIIIILALI